MEVLILLLACIGTGTYAAYRHRVEAPLRALEADAHAAAQEATGHRHPRWWPCRACRAEEAAYITNALAPAPDAHPWHDAA